MRLQTFLASTLHMMKGQDFLVATVGRSDVRCFFIIENFTRNKYNSGKSVARYYTAKEESIKLYHLFQRRKPTKFLTVKKIISSIGVSPFLSRAKENCNFFILYSFHKLGVTEKESGKRKKIKRKAMICNVKVG